MTRYHRPVVRYQAPSYYEHAGKPHARGAVIYGPHLDVDPEDPAALHDPFSMARRFAHSMAAETGEPFVWGWYETPEGLRPAVCALGRVDKGFLAHGNTTQVDDAPCHKASWQL